MADLFGAKSSSSGASGAPPGAPPAGPAGASGFIPDLSSIGTGLANAAESIKDATASATSGFASTESVGASASEFLNSNSLLAKFAFVVLALIVFLFLLNLGISLVSYFTRPSKSPYLIWGMKSGTDYTVITQDPGSKNGITYRSNNQPSGAEFTWSAWLKFDNIPVGDNKYRVIFVKGTDTYGSSDGIATVNNGPGLYFTASTDTVSRGSTANPNVESLHGTLHYVMDVVSPINNAQVSTQYADIPNIPLNKWVHVAIRLQNKVLDCYVNGVITTRVSFGDYIPKQNYDNVVYAGNGGFPGAISNLRYYDRALSVFELNSLVYYGPNLNAANSSTNYTGYLGRPWYNASASN
jgi:hypothetical protein